MLQPDTCTLPSDIILTLGQPIVANGKETSLGKFTFPHVVRASFELTTVRDPGFVHLRLNHSATVAFVMYRLSTEYDHHLRQLQLCIFASWKEKFSMEVLWDVIPYSYEQYNARPHPVRVFQRYLQQQQADVFPWPANSPDHSPIEHVFDSDQMSTSSASCPVNATRTQKTAPEPCRCRNGTTAEVSTSSRYLPKFILPSINTSWVLL